MIPHRDVAQHPLSKPEREEILPVGDLCRFIIGGTVNEIIDGLWQTSLRLHLQLIDGKCRDHEPLLCFYPGPASRVQIGRAHVRTPVTNAHLVCRLLLVKHTMIHNTHKPSTHKLSLHSHNSTTSTRH